MNFDWTSEEAAFRARVRAAIERYLERDWGPRDFELSTPELQRSCLAFCQALAGEGLLTPDWPVEYGGQAASPWEQLILSEEMHGAHEPRGPQYMNVNWIGPAIMAHGTPEQRAFHLPKIARGEVFWCQGFSEPNAGSDLAAMRTTAVSDQGEYVINGQKVWTSYAHCADYCILLARTDLEVDPRRGISAFLLPMDTPGVEVRDIPNVAGDHIIHEVFFRDVRVDQSVRLGAENQGWPIVLSALANERIGIARFELSARVLDSAVRALPGPGLKSASDHVRVAVGRAFAATEAARILNYVAVQERSSASSVAARPAAAISRVATTIAVKQVARAARQLAGQHALVDPKLDEQHIAAVTVPIAAGSYEMQLNNVARLSLGLPRG
jgi:alkylation response protein AidB-like acyl-CoA dehydrogenase